MSKFYDLIDEIGVPVERSSCKTGASNLAEICSVAAVRGKRGSKGCGVLVVVIFT